jgi:hypothetical protein
VLRKTVLSRYWVANAWLQQAPLREQTAPSISGVSRPR